MNQSFNLGKFEEHLLRLMLTLQLDMQFPPTPAGQPPAASLTGHPNFHSLM